MLYGIAANMCGARGIGDAKRASAYAVKALAIGSDNERFVAFLKTLVIDEDGTEDVAEVQEEKEEHGHEHGEEKDKAGSEYRRKAFHISLRCLRRRVCLPVFFNPRGRKGSREGLP